MNGNQVSKPVPTSSTTAAVEQTPGNIKEFTVDGSNYSFNPAEIRVKKGDTVKITFKDGDGQHNLVVDGYNVSTSTIGPGSTDSVTFVADKAGTFEYFCSVDSHRDLGMKGSLVVE